MDTDSQMNLMICQSALEMYSPIEVAIEQRRYGYAKEQLARLRSFLQSQTQHGSFRSAKASLPQASSLSGASRSELRNSRRYIEEYMASLKRDS
jgi:hypothetical protein